MIIGKKNKPNESTTAMLRWDTAASTDIDSNNVKYIHGVSKYALPRKCHTGATPPPSLQLMSPQFRFFLIHRSAFPDAETQDDGGKKWYEITLFWCGDSIFLFSVAVKVTDWGFSLLKRHAVRLTGGALGGKNTHRTQSKFYLPPPPLPPPTTPVFNPQRCLTSHTISMHTHCQQVGR